MTEHELHSLIVEHLALTFDNFETWAGITAGMLLAGHYGGRKIGSLLRRIIAVSYITAGILIVSNLIQLSYAINAYRIQIEHLDAMDFPFQTLAGWTSGIASFSIIIIGTITATYYFLKSTSQKSGSAN